jgi:hypothetical protein
MADQDKGLTSDELEEQNAEELPEREAMSVIALEPQGVHDLELPESQQPIADKGPVPGGQIDN